MKISPPMILGKDLYLAMFVPIFFQIVSNVLKNCELHVFAQLIKK